VNRAIFTYAACSLLLAVLLWLIFSAILLGEVLPGRFLNAFGNLTRPATFTDFGQAFSAFEGFVSSVALVLGLIALLLQIQYNKASNRLSALSARLQFLAAEFSRLDEAIARIYGEKNQEEYGVAENMSDRRSRILHELKQTDKKVRKLLVQSGETLDDYDSPNTRLKAKDTDELLANVGERVQVTGDVITVYYDETKRLGFLNFDDTTESTFYAMISSDIAIDKSILERDYNGKTVSVIGELRLFEDPKTKIKKPQIIVNKLSQIRLV
jgi:hypothetical protein